jgi:hypothetical protein
MMTSMAAVSGRARAVRQTSRPDPARHHHVGSPSSGAAEMLSVALSPLVAVTTVNPSRRAADELQHIGIVISDEDFLGG